MKLRSGLILTAGVAAITGLAALSPRDSAPYDSGKGRTDKPAIDFATLNNAACGPKDALGARLQRYASLTTPAAAPGDESGMDVGEAAVPLWDNLGTATMAVTSDIPEVQAYFDQGLRFVYAFNHWEAIRAFRAAQALDPNCAMCFWGEALALGPNINAPMDPSAVAPAFMASRKALALAASATAKEQALIEALSARYVELQGGDRTAFDAAYADAMVGVAAAHPGDPHVETLLAQAVMNLSPWDYWEQDGRTNKGRSGLARAALERALEADPAHAGAIHYYIHMMEASATPEAAEPYADRLLTLMPGAGHIVHMPSHIYFRIGRFHDSLNANIMAVAADDAYFEQSESDTAYKYGYHPHNIDFLIVSARMAGEKKAALYGVERLDAALSDDLARQLGWVQMIKATPYYAHAQFSDLETVLGLPDPGADFPLIQAVRAYARGVALARAGDVAQAGMELARIRRTARDVDLSFLTDQGVPAPEIAAIAGEVLEGRIAYANKDYAAAEAAYSRAIEIEDSLPYIEPPYWYYPVRQSLGAAQLKRGDAKSAEWSFAQSLLKTPNNAYALYGLWQARKRLGDNPGAKDAKTRFRAAWAGGRKTPRLNEL